MHRMSFRLFYVSKLGTLSVHVSAPRKRFVSWVRVIYEGLSLSKITLDRVEYVVSYGTRQLAARIGKL